MPTKEEVEKELDQYKSELESAQREIVQLKHKLVIAFDMIKAVFNHISPY